MWHKQDGLKRNILKSRKCLWAQNLSLIILFLLSLNPLNAEASEVTLAWDPPSTEYGGFILSYGLNSGSFSHNIDVGTNTIQTVRNLEAGQTYFFAVKAYGTNQIHESSYSNWVNVTIPALDTTPPASPKMVEIVSGS